jgi:broad specificity phosphatase PhoE
MKKIYFVRHGESEENVGLFIGDSNSLLTENGKNQSEVIARRCENLPIESVVASNFVRAQETAKTISNKINIPIETSDLFSEKRRPSDHVGKLKTDEQVLEDSKTIRENFHDEDFRLQDEETFSELKLRAKEALLFLQNKPEQEILVVTHALFLAVIIAYVIFGEELTSFECKKVIRTLRMENTGMTVLKFDEKREKNPWILWIWNDHAHLG